MGNLLFASLAVNVLFLILFLSNRVLFLKKSYAGCKLISFQITEEVKKIMSLLEIKDERELTVQALAYYCTVAETIIETGEYPFIIKNKGTSEEIRESMMDKFLQKLHEDIKEG